MTENNMMGYAVKGILMALTDIIVLMFFILIEKIYIKPWLVPYAILFIFISLFVLNIVVLLSKKIYLALGVGAATAIITSVIIYTVIQLATTAIFYYTITTNMYIIYNLVLIAAALSICYAAAIAGKHKVSMESHDRRESNTSLAINVVMGDIEAAIHRLKDEGSTNTFESTLKAFQKANERLCASTPFGRRNEAFIVDTENKIFEKVKIVQESISKASDLTGDAYNTALKQSQAVLDEIWQLIIRREKFMIR